MNKPTLYLRTVLLQASQEFSRCLIRVLVDRIDFVAGLKVNYVVPETFPYRDPLGPQIIKDIHGCSSMLSVMSSAQLSRNRAGQKGRLINTLSRAFALW
jgi:hypothetical protein